MGKELFLLDFCLEESVTTISCGSCDISAAMDEEAIFAIDSFYQNGWRVRKGICYCPGCSEKNGLLINKKAPT